MLSFLSPAVSIAYHAVTVIASILAPAIGTLAPAAAIIAVTLAVRLALLPLSYYAMRGQAAQALLAPRVAELRRRYARQPDRLQRELAALYQAETGSLLAGCLPLLAQLPVFSVLYRLFLSPSIAGQPNRLLTSTLLHIPLGARWLRLAWPPLRGAALLPGHALAFAGLAALIALAGWASARLTRRHAAPATPATLAAPGTGAPGTGVPAVLTRLAPYTSAVIALFVPLAAGLYLLTTAAWTLTERAALLRRAQAAAASRDTARRMNEPRPRPATR
jgi:YidC/Oxa1 family membrane protein insertase